METVLSEILSLFRNIFRTVMCFVFVVVIIALVKKFTSIGLEQIWFGGGMLFIGLDTHFFTLTKK